MKETIIQTVYHKGSFCDVILEEFNDLTCCYFIKHRFSKRESESFSSLAALFNTLESGLLVWHP